MEQQVSAFPYALARLLQANGITAADLAQRIDCSVEHVEQLLKGISLPSPAILKEICLQLHVVYDTMYALLESDRAMRLHRRATDLRRKASAG